ncbi:MAG: F-type H+-transporting ATPase subunit delta [Flavobacteriales bacterium]|jgi:F-type H+-transporting ATPase subunit delta
MAELTTLARPYAKAAFEHALGESALASWSDALALLAAVSEQELPAKLFASPSVTADAKSTAMNDICGDKLNDKQQNFVKILSENGRLSLLTQVFALYELFKANQEKTIDVSVESAFEISDEQLNALEVGLKKNLARDVACQTTVNKELLGGVLIRAGDTVIDASIRGRLAKLAEAMNA